jgi:hypothetical protein
VEEPNKAEKILYNAYYQYAPAVLWNTWPGYQTDKYLNVSPAVSQIIYFNLAHNSDPGFPRVNPTSRGYFYSEWVQQLLPEQSKYQTALILLPDDPSRGQELYVFLHSLRRSLRLSASARCAPIAGTDWANDDSKDGMNRIPTQFTADLLGEKKILALVHEDGALRGDPKNFYTGHSAPFHKAVTGKWELRDVWVVDEVPRPSLANGTAIRTTSFISTRNSTRSWRVNTTTARASCGRSSSATARRTRCVDSRKTVSRFPPATSRSGSTTCRTRT